jgi:succinate dehydrogenase/fumarate reductase-like Fe-S protein
MASIQSRVKSNGAANCTTTTHTHLATKVFNMTPLETLKAARQLITDPAKWVQRFKALDEFALPVDPKSERAICFCALGAMQNVTGLSRYHRPVFDAAIAKLEGV